MHHHPRPSSNADITTRLAHFYWEQEGKPNGEELRDSYVEGKLCPMKVRDIHWSQASYMAARKVVDAYSHGGYIHFVLDDGQDLKFGTLWAFGTWTGSDRHVELQHLLRLTPYNHSQCQGCHITIGYRFRPEEMICPSCHSTKETDRDIMDIMNRIAAIES